MNKPLKTHSKLLCLPDEIEEVVLSSDESGLPIANAMKDSGLVKSTSEAMRMLKQGAVKIDGEKVTDKGIVLRSGSSQIIQVGKRRIATVTLQ